MNYFNIATNFYKNYFNIATNFYKNYFNIATNFYKNEAKLTNLTLLNILIIIRLK